MVKIQTKIESFIESNMNVISGFVISWCVWMWVVAPLFAIETGAGRGFLITSIFTISSLIRSYILRRIFNWRSERRINGRTRHEVS